MNDTMIEKILFNAPNPAAPAELLKTLQAEIPMPRANVAMRNDGLWQSPMKRWFPALAFCLLMLSCAIMIAVQGSQSASLKRQNQALEKSAAALPQLRQQHAALEQVLAEQDELSQLRKDNDEMHRLQAEVAQLPTLSGKIVQLKSENQQLAKTLSTPAAAPMNAENFFDEAQQRADRIQCINNLKQLGLAMRVWSLDNSNRYSTSLVVMSNEISAVKVLICPSDKARLANGSLSWSEFQDNMTSYQYLARPDDENYPNCIVAFCPIHHNYLLADGSVQSVNPAAVKEVKKDGRWYLQPINSNSAQ